MQAIKHCLTACDFIQGFVFISCVCDLNVHNVENSDCTFKDNSGYKDGYFLSRKSLESYSTGKDKLSFFIDFYFTMKNDHGEIQVFLNVPAVSVSLWCTVMCCMSFGV